MSVDKLVTDILGERPNVKDRALRELIDARMKKGGAVVMKRGGRAKGETLASMDTGKVETRKAPGAEKAERILSGAVELLPGVAAGKSAIEGEYQKALIEAGLDVAGGPLAKGLGAAIPAVAGIFIGSNARLWDKAAAKEFKKLEKAGVSNEEAFKQTNTFRSPDGELRQEISDRPARLKGEKLRDISGALQLNVDAPQKAKLEKMYADIFDQMKSSGTDAPLSQLIYHPELFKAYPELESLRGRYNIIPSMPETGYYNLGSPTTPPRLGAEGPTPESARSSMLHEIQHAIQHLEGFGMGGNPEMGMTMLPRSMDAVDYLNQLRKSKMNLLDEQARLAKEFKESGAQYTLDNPLVQRSIELPNKIDDVDQAIEGIVQGYFYPMYKRMAGEAESRAIQARRQMSPQELRDVFPLSSYDVPVDQLIVKRVPPYANGGAVMMAGGGEAQAAPYGLRETGMPKGKGYFGELPTADGVMTELSASDDAGDFPLIVPTLTAAELKHLQSGGEPTAEIYAKAKAWAESRKGQGRDPFATSEDLRMPVPEYAKGGEVKMVDGGPPGKNVGRGMAGLRRSRQELDPREIQATFLDVPAGVGFPFAEAGAEALRGNIEDAKTSAAIDAALTAVPVAGVLAKPAYRAVKSGVKKAAPAVREAARGALESGVESGAILDPRMQAIAYHGSPHKFEKFDASKIGTGEGAQSYGHGLYFAEAPDVAGSYKTKLGGLKPANEEDISFDVSHFMGDDIGEHAAGRADAIHHRGSSIEYVFEDGSVGILDNEGRFTPYGQPQGHLYTVDIPDESVARMLDWDKPLEKQPAIRELLRGTDYEVGVTAKEAEKIADERLRQEAYDWADETGGDPVDYMNNANWEKYVDDVMQESGKVHGSTTGEELHKIIMRDQGYRKELFDPYNYQVDTSETLRGLGIPGIKYLDATSRSAGEGTRNFVVFPGEEESVKILERKKKGGAVQKYGKGGVVKGLIKRASEALGEHEGKRLFITQSDRTKVGGKYLGGPGFSSLQLTEPFYRDVNAVWGVKGKSTASTMINAQKESAEPAIWTTFIGSPEQHKSNQQVFDEMLSKFRASAKKGNLDPDLRAAINAKLASAVDEKTGKPLFPDDVDILSPKLRQLASTFDRRGIVADLIGGKGIGGKKGQIIDYQDILDKTSDPMLVGQPTYAVGPRLFELHGDVMERPDLHPAFPVILTGRDLDTAFSPVPHDLAMKDLVERIGRTPGHYDLTRGGPSQFLSEEFLTGLQKSGYKKGGAVGKGALPKKRA